MSAKSPRYIDLIPVTEAGLTKASNLPVKLPYDLEPIDFLRTVEDVHRLINRLNTVLHGVHYPPLEGLLDSAAFSGFVSRTVATRLAAASHSLVVNTYPNGYPDLIRSGAYVRDSVALGEGLEVKASGSDGNWQSHGPRGGWFVWLQFARDNDPAKAVFDREPTQVQAVMVANLNVEDWSWQPAGAGKIRSGTASVKVSGRKKLREGAVWVAPDYAAEHSRLLEGARSRMFDPKTADASVLAAIKASPSPVHFSAVAASIAPTFGLDAGVIEKRVDSACKRLVKSGAITRVSAGTYH